jgi:hypothetical protein
MGNGHGPGARPDAIAVCAPVRECHGKEVPTGSTPESNALSPYSSPPLATRASSDVSFVHRTAPPAEMVTSSESPLRCALAVGNSGDG